MGGDGGGGKTVEKGNLGLFLPKNSLNLSPKEVEVDGRGGGEKLIVFMS